MAIITSLIHYLIFLNTPELLDKIDFFYTNLFQGNFKFTTKQMRIIVPILYAFFKKISFSETHVAYLLTEGLIALLTYSVFWKFLKSYLNGPEKILGLLFLNGLVVASFAWSFTLGTTINLALFTLCLLCIERKSAFYLLSLSIFLLALQRIDLAAFASIIYLFGQEKEGSPWSKRVFKTAFLLSMVFVLGFVIKLALDINDGLGMQFYRHIDGKKTLLFLANLKRPWLFILEFNLLLILPFINFKKKPVLLRRGLIIMIPYFLILLVVGDLIDLRLFFPFMVFLIPLSILTLRPILTPLIQSDLRFPYN